MNILTIGIMIINCIALIIAIILIFAYRRKFQGIKHYEKIRDKVTIRKPKSEFKLPNINFGGGNLIGGIVNIGIGCIILNTVYFSTVNELYNSTSMFTGSEIALWNVFGLAGIIGLLIGVLKVFDIL